MRSFQHIFCAVIVFIAYTKLGYYHPWQIGKALLGYFSEKRRLGGDVLSVNKWGFPIGTLMCSVDKPGQLPTDTVFTDEMHALRTQYAGRLGYFGKFAVIPSLQGKLVGKQLLANAVTEWSFAHGVEVAVMMVNPAHVGLYRRYGAVEISRTDGTRGLEKAPAVLLVLDFSAPNKVREYREQYLRLNELQTEISKAEGDFVAS